MEGRFLAAAVLGGAADREPLALGPGAAVRELERTLTGNLLAVAELVSTYER